MTKSDNLTDQLKKTLLTLNRLSEQIRKTNDLSESSELILCLEEIINEQMAVSSVEDLSHTTHATR